MIDSKVIVLFVLFTLLITEVGAQMTFDTLPLLYCGGRDPASGNHQLFWDQPPVQACGTASRVTILGKIMEQDPFTVLAENVDPVDGFYALNQRFYSVFQLIFHYDNCSGDEAQIVSNIYSFEEPRVELRDVSFIGDDVLVQWYPYRDGVSGVTYRIVQRINGTEVVIADNISSTSYLLVDVLDETPGIYDIYAVDACGNNSPPLFFTYILLSAEDPGFCDDRISLEWSEFPFPSAAIVYEIQYLDSAGNWYTAGQTGGTGISLNYPPGDSLSVRIFAQVTDDISTVSNSVSVALPPYHPQTFIDIQNVSFDLTNSLSINWRSDPDADIEQYTLLENGQVIDSRDNSAPDWSVLSPSLLSGTEYVITSRDECDNIFPSPNVFSPILTVSTMATEVELSTISAISSAHSTQQYMWYQVVNGSLVLWGSTQEPSYELPSSSVSDSSCFVVHIHSNYNGQDGVQSVISQSNVACLRSSFDIFVPNVIQLSNSNPVNRRFSISTSNDNQVSSLEYYIYDRRGSLLYKGLGLADQWLPVNNSYANQTLAYTMKVLLRNGVSINKAGTLLILP